MGLIWLMTGMLEEGGGWMVIFLWLRPRHKCMKFVQIKTRKETNANTLMYVIQDHRFCSTAMIFNESLPKVPLAFLFLRLFLKVEKSLTSFHKIIQLDSEWGRSVTMIFKDYKNITMNISSKMLRLPLFHKSLSPPVAFDYRTMLMPSSRLDAIISQLIHCSS